MLTLGVTILYVEDDEGDQFFMQLAFRAAGLDSALKIVSDGAAAIDYLSGAGKYCDRTQHPAPQLVLLDLKLPHIPGFEVLQWIRSQASLATLPVIIFSSSVYEEDRGKAKALGANDFWTKPNSGLQFDATVAALRQTWFPRLAAPAAACEGSA